MEDTERQMPRKRGKHGKRWRKALLIVLAVLVVIGGAGYFTLRHFLGKLNQVNESTQSVLSQDEYIRLMREMYGSDWMPETAAPSGKNSTAADSGDKTEAEQTAAEKTAAEKTAAEKTAAERTSDRAGNTTAPPLPTKNRPTKAAATESETGDNGDDNGFPYSTDWKTAAPLNDEGLINIMLVGNDYASSDIGFSDTMILCSVNPNTHQASLISFMRDMHLPMGDYGYNNLNHAYAIGGFYMLDRVLEENFGVHVDGYVGVGIYDFENIINYMGGVDLWLTQAEADLINIGDTVNPGYKEPEPVPTQPAATEAESTDASTEASAESTEETSSEAGSEACTEEETEASTEETAEETEEEPTEAASTEGETEAETTEASTEASTEADTAAEPTEAASTEGGSDEETPESSSAEEIPESVPEEPAAQDDNTQPQAGDSDGNDPAQPENPESNAADYGHLTAGWNHLNGSQAVYYARIREIDSDFQRTERQRTLLNALFDKVKNAGLGSLMNMMNDILPLVSTTMSSSEIMSYAAQVLPYFGSTSISNYRIPKEGSYCNDFVYGQYVMRCNQYINVNYLNSILPY